MDSNEFKYVAIFSIVAVIGMSFLVMYSMKVPAETGMAPVFNPGYDVPKRCIANTPESHSTCTIGYSIQARCEMAHPKVICRESFGAWYADNDCNGKVHCQDEYCLALVGSRAMGCPSINIQRNTLRI